MRDFFGEFEETSTPVSSQLRRRSARIGTTIVHKCQKRRRLTLSLCAVVARCGHLARMDKTALGLAAPAVDRHHDHLPGRALLVAMEPGRICWSAGQPAPAT